MSAPKPIRAKLKQETPAELIESILQTVREVYCPNKPLKDWIKTDQEKVKEWCIFWPAKFIVKKHFTLPGDRFKEILVDIITDSKRHVTGTITYLPAFLGKCVQSHFEKRWEIYYKEAKSTQAATEAAFLALKALPVQTDKAVETMAAAADLLKAKKKSQAKPEPKLAKPVDQFNLFDV